MILPTIDGHFWVVRDGKIIDPHFPEYDLICKIRSCDPKADKSYIPAPEMTQKIMIDMFKKCFKKHLKGDTIEELSKELLIISGDYKKPVVSCCFQNSLMEIAKNGGQLIFGSLGFKYAKKDGYFYEFGGEDYKTIKQFLV